MMDTQKGIPAVAVTAVTDLLDNCARVQSGQEVLIMAEVDGLYNNMVDEEAISWIQYGVQARGANASILWIDEIPKINAWRIPPIAKAAMASCHVLINNTFNLSTQDMGNLRQFINEENNFLSVRNFATTSSLLCTAWAQTPYELVSEIRYQTSQLIVAGKPFLLTDPNGTHLEGVIRGSRRGNQNVSASSRAGKKRKNISFWPEWMYSPTRVDNTNGIYVFDRMLSWWSRYIGISPFFDKPIELTIIDNHITEIRGGDEADALRRFLASMVAHLGNDVYRFEIFHFGVHPQARVAPHQCPNPLIRRIIDHSNSCNVHFHIGNAEPTAQYPYIMHVTADIRKPTLKVGDAVVYSSGHLATLDNPDVLALAQKYPGRPGVIPEPRSF